MRHKRQNRADLGQSCACIERVERGVGRVLGQRAAIHWELGGVLVQTAAHQVNAGQNHAADVSSAAVDSVDGGRRACADDEVVLLRGDGLCAEQLGIAVCAHFGGVVVELEIFKCRLRSDDVNRCEREQGVQSFTNQF